MKKIISLTLIIASFILILGSVSASASFGSGVAAVANDVTLIKSGLFGKKLTFSDTDVKQGLCISDFNSITITKIPSSTEGTLMLMGRRVGENQTIKRKNIASLVFIPAASDLAEARFSFTVEPYTEVGELEFILKFTDKINHEPKTDTEALESSYIKTQRDIDTYGKMYAADPEGDSLEFIILSYPKGILTLTDKKTGEYRYTPPESFTGEDSFTYVVRDEWGNYSVPVTVEITVDERMSEVIYTDMENRGEYNAAVALSAMGIMGGDIVGDNIYFNPEKAVSRAEFVAMAMKSVGMRADSTLVTSFFDDNSEIPEALVSYVATAQIAGIINGEFTKDGLVFTPNEAITKYEAARVMAKILGASASTDVPVYNELLSVPTFARSEVLAMYEIGVFDEYTDAETLSDSVSRAECASYLYKIMK